MPDDPEVLDPRPEQLSKPEVPTTALGLKLDIDKVKRTISRFITNRMKKADRYNSLSLFGEKRKRAKADPKDWTYKPMPGDTPDTQMLLHLADELEKLEGDAEIDERLRENLKCNLRKQMSDLIGSAELANTKLFTELLSMVEHEQRVREHNDKMRAVAGQGDENLSDAELLDLARKAEGRTTIPPERLDHLLEPSE